MAIQRPEVFNNGAVSWVDSDLLDMLRYGYAPLGWEGDPNMNLWYDNVDRRVYLTSIADDGSQYEVARSKPDMKIDSMNLIKMLVEHDRNRGYNLAQDMDNKDAKVIADIEKKNDEQFQEVAKKLTWGFQKDLK